MSEEIAVRVPEVVLEERPETPAEEPTQDTSAPSEEEMSGAC